jgi:NACHT domain
VLWLGILSPRALSQVSGGETKSALVNGSLAALDDGSRDVRIFALHYLAETQEKLSPADASKSLRRLRSFENDQSPGMRALAGKAWTNIWANNRGADVLPAEAKNVAQKMGALVGYADSTVHRDALGALKNLGPSAIDEADKITPFLNTADDSAIEALESMRDTPADAVRSLADKITQSLPARSEESRRAALEVLTQFGGSANACAAAIADFAQKAEDDTRVRALEALAGIGPGPGIELEKFEQKVTGYLMSETEPAPVRMAAANAAATAANLRGSFKCDIGRLLANSRSEIRQAVVSAVRKAPQAAAGQLAGVYPLLDSAEESIKADGIAAVGAMGAAAVAQDKNLPERFRNLIKSQTSSAVRIAATSALAELDRPNGKYVADFVELLKSDDGALREQAVAALITVKDVMGDHVSLIGDLLQYKAAKTEEQTRVRVAALSLLAKLGAPALPYLGKICDLLGEQNPGDIRLAALNCVAGLQQATPEGLRALCQAVSTPSGYEVEAMKAIAAIGAPAKSCARQISVLLANAKTRLNGPATKTLFALGPLDGESIAAILMAAREFKRLKEDGRAVELQFLAHRAGGGDEQTELLIRWQGIERPPSKKLSRIEGIALLNAIERGWTLAESERWKATLAESTSNIIAQTEWSPEADLAILKKQSERLRPQDPNAAGAVDRVIVNLQGGGGAQKKSWQTVLREKALLALPLIYALIVLGIYRVRPLFLLTLNEAGAQRLIDLLPSWLGGKAIKVFQALLLTLLYRPRVLDAWVEKYSAAARERFNSKRTVQARGVHVLLPAVVNGEMVPDFTPPKLKRIFEQPLIRILIFGEGGSGKTSLACQIARAGMSDDREQRPGAHRILPVLIETELSSAEDARKRLFETIRRQLQDLVGESNQIPAELVENLLRKRRVLVIVDHFSEMSEATRKTVDLTSAEFPVNCLIVTSRVEEKILENDVVVRPTRIEGKRLSSFVDAYMVRQKKRDLFVDVEFFEVCRRLAELVGDRQITVLLAKLYVEYVIAVKEEPALAADIGNIPDLMLSYLNAVNSAIEPETRRPNRDVQEDAMIVAWECLRERLQPVLAAKPDVIAALGGEDAGVEERLAYLEKRLGAIQTVGSAENFIRFALDPLAEYFAALRLMQILGKDEAEWKRFLGFLDSAAPETPEKAAEPAIETQTPRGFLQALYDCCLGNSLGLTAPEFVKAALTNFLQQVRQG